MFQEEMKQNDIHGEDFLCAAFIGNMIAIETYITSGGDIEYQAVRGKTKDDVYPRVYYYSSDDDDSYDDDSDDDDSYDDDSDDDDIDDDDVIGTDIKTADADATAIDDNIGQSTIYRTLGRVSEEIGTSLYTLQISLFSR